MLRHGLRIVGVGHRRCFGNWISKHGQQAAPPTVVVHGGAWAFPDELDGPSLLGVQRASQRGFAVLTSGGTAVDAVVAAVSVLEEDPAFDAGRGSALNSDGNVEMDALLVDGHSMRAGAVCGVSNTLHPIELARLVMDHTEHVMLAGEGANRFAKEMGVTEVPTEELVTAEALRQFEAYKKYGHAVVDLFNKVHDTVGAVAIDGAGRIAAATSTGGIPLKRVGRVGDSPLIGCGAWARNATGGCSTTGHGESIMRVLLARDVIARLETGTTIQAALDDSLASMRQLTGGCGGAVSLDSAGNAGILATTPKMPWALFSTDQRGMQSGLRANRTSEVEAALLASPRIHG